MTRAVFLLALLAVAVPPKERDLPRDLLSRVEPRAGVSDGLLAVVPLVIRAEAETCSGPASGPVDWRPEGPEVVAISRREGEAVVFVPGGLLLEGGTRERLLSRPLLVGAANAITAARAADRREEPAPSGGTRITGSIAPPLQRKLDLLLKDEETLRDLLEVQAHYAGLGEGQVRVQDLFTGPDIVTRVRALMEQLGKIPGGYAGGTAGYVAFFGFRPVEVVCFRSPDLFRQLGPAYLRALAVESAIWDVATGSEPPPETPAVPGLIREARDVLDRLRDARVREIRCRGKEKGGGRQYLVVGRASEDEQGEVREYGGRLLIDGEGWPVFLEAFECGGHIAFPVPLDRLGGRPVNARPNVKSGAMTQGFLIRLAARRASLRAALGAARR